LLRILRFINEGRDVVFPYRWSYWLFCAGLIAFVLVFPVFGVALGVITPGATYWLGIYCICIIATTLGMSFFHGLKCMKKRGAYVNGYKFRRVLAGAGIVFFAWFPIYFTVFLVQIPFGTQPNYVFTLKPSKALEMEVNQLMGDDIVEYTPFDYSLDEQVVVYKTNTLLSLSDGMLWRLVHKPEGRIPALKAKDVAFGLSLIRSEFYDVKRVSQFDGACVFIFNMDKPLTSVVSSEIVGDFNGSIVVKSDAESSSKLYVSAEGVYSPYHDSDKCYDTREEGDDTPNRTKRYVTEALFLYPHIYHDIAGYKEVDRHTFTFTLEHFDDYIANYDFDYR